jgi:hypothetical protein
MAQTGIFISSCSRRELARRRPARNSALRLQAVVALVVLAAGLVALLVARAAI